MIHILRTTPVPGPRAFAAVCVLLLGLSGCRTGSPVGEAEDLGEAVPIMMPKTISTAVPKAPVLDETPLKVADIVPELAEGQEDEFRLPERVVEEPPAPPVAEYPSNLIKGVSDPDETVPVTLNFDATPLTEVIPMFGDVLLGFGYMIDPGVKGAVTIKIEEAPMTARDTWALFEHILWLAGAYASRNPGFIHILPFSKMPQERRLLAQHDPLANVEVSFVRVLNTKSAELIGNVKPFMTDGSSITDIPRLNTLLIVEAPSNMPKLRELITRLDDKGESGWPHFCMRCHQVDVEIVVDELNALMPVLGFPVAAAGPSGGQVKLTAIPRLQVIVASCAVNEVLDEVKRWVRVLDKQDTAEQESIFFYNVRHSTAEHLSEALAVFFNTSTTQSAKRSPTTKSTSSKAAPTSGSTTPRTSTATTTARKLEEGEGGTIFDTPVVVYADTVQNRLTVRTTQRAYAMVEALLSRLDAPQRQVAIQAYIAEVILRENTKFGFAFAATEALGNDYTFRSGASHPATGLPSTIASAGTENGIAFLFAKDNTGSITDKLAFIEAVAGKTNVKILSAPQIVAASDEEAVINVGRRIPTVTEYYSGDNTGTNFRSSIQYVDTGTILTVVPHITAGNEVRLEVTQEVSDAAEDASLGDVGKQSPAISNKQLQSTLVIPDAATVLMGGLITSKEEGGHAGVPVLKDLPGIGRLFRTNVESSERTELLVMISVNVIDGESTSDTLVRRYEAALREIRKNFDI